jgi:RecB family exonuclease
MGTERKIGLALLLGPVNSGKLGHVLEWWRQRLSEKPVVVTPTGPDTRELTAEIVRRAGGLIGHAPVVTFDGLVHMLVGRSPRYATEFERELVVSRLLRDTPTKALRQAARLPGAVTALKTLLQQLGESGRGPAEIDRILARWAAADPQAALLAEDIRQLSAAYYLECLRLGVEDRPAVVREALEVVRASAESGAARPVAFYGFTSFSPGQRLLIEQLSRQTEVFVAITYDAARDVNLCTPAEIAWWRAKAADVQEVSALIRAYHSPAIAYLERFFMSDEPRLGPPQATSVNEGVRFMKASGRRAEAELTAEQIAELVRAGVDAQDIAVVVRNVSVWSSLLARVFDSCGIAFSIDDRPLLGQTGLGHAFLNVIKGVFLDDAGALLAYMRSPYSGISLETVSDLELRYRRATAKEALVLAGIGRETGLDHVARLWELDRAQQFDPVAGRALIRRMFAAAAEGVVAGGREIEEDARAFRALDGALSTLTHLVCARDCDSPGNAAPSLDCRVLLGSLGSVVVGGIGGDGGGAVHVLSVQRARARRFPVVFVLGLVEGEFPGRSDRPTLLSPPQRTRLDRLGGGLFAPDSDEEAAFFVSALSRASTLLFLSTRDAEDDGSEAAPSHFWTWAKNLLGVHESEHLSRTLGDQVFALHTAPTRRHYERACVARGLGLNYGRGAAEGARAVPSWDCVPRTLSDRGVLAELAGAQRFSPSALESYARCPFVWFVQRVVGAEELETDLDARQVGQLLHGVLSSTYQELGSAGLLPLRADGVAAAERIAGSKIEELVNSADCPGTAGERRLAAWQLRRMVRNLFDMEVAADWSLTPHELEMWVGSRHGVDVGGFKVHGRIDRVDATCDRRGLFVIDYKSGNVPTTSAIGSEEGLQLPLYLMAIAAERPSDSVLGGAYLALSEKKRSGVVIEGAEHLLGDAAQGYRVLDQAALEELFQKTRDLSRQAIEGMRCGVIAPRDDRSCPPWCLLAPACRARRGGFRP